MEPEERPDEILVEEAQSALEGDHRAFEALVHRHQAGVLANCRYLSGSAEEAKDLAQEVFVKVYFALPSFERRSMFKTWVQRIKINHCLNHIRKRRGKVFLDADDPKALAAEEMRVEERATGEVEAGADRARIRQVLDSLTETLRIPLILCDLDGLSYQEAADELGIGLSALKMRLKRAREKFREAYGPRRGAV
ncbi:MAG: RNA polymerase sigma factor [Candidatus Eisenbacteria bacterium]